MKEDTIRIEGSILAEQQYRAEQPYKGKQQEYKPIKGRTYIGQQTYYEIYKDLENGLREFISATPYEWIAKDVCERYGFNYESYYVAVEI